MKQLARVTVKYMDENTEHREMSRITWKPRWKYKVPNSLGQRICILISHCIHRRIKLLRTNLQLRIAIRHIPTHHIDQIMRNLA
jgi:hypothetical protein